MLVRTVPLVIKNQFPRKNGCVIANTDCLTQSILSGDEVLLGALGIKEVTVCMATNRPRVPNIDMKRLGLRNGIEDKPEHHALYDGGRSAISGG